MPYMATAQRSMAMRFARAYMAGEDVQSWTRYEVGYSLPMATATYTDQVRIVDDYGHVTTKSVSHSSEAKSAFGTIAGTYFPISNMGDNSILAVSVAAKGNFYVFNSGIVYLDSLGVGGGSGSSYQYDFVSMEVGLPVSMDMKFGCDAVQNKRKRLCFTAGFGMAPTMIITGIPTGVNPDGSTELGAGKAKFIVEPFLKAEVGAMVGICIKVRAMYSFGNIKYYNVSDDFESVTLTGKSNLTLSLILMPFSFAWKNSAF